nr:probable serine/threonine-protein kinase kinX isoform X1 [Ciona intestinalis]|eukprot:XP_002130300.2 probable serine/threonine-protein kinase kinX isoform X1 [Ciona intestinalis]
MTTLAADVNQDRQSNYHQQDHLVTMHQPETAKNVHVYLNGDRFFPGRKFVVNRRHISDFDGFLNQVTVGMKAPFGAVRNIYTPNLGHRVRDLTQLQNGMDLVAGGVERFRKIQYKEIYLRKKPPPRRTIFQLPHHNRMNVSARWRKYVKEPCQIYVYGNGDINAPAIRLLLIPRAMKSWDLVLSEITEKICLRTGKAVRKLYDMDYHLLGDPSELENGKYYIAVGTERIKKIAYGDINSMQKTHSPRRGNPLPPIKRRPRPPQKEGDDQTYTKMYAQRKQHKEEEETTVMGASALTGYRPLKTKKYKPKPPGAHPTHEGESVFHAKPVKVKRSGKMNNIPHPPSAESDGVFHANGETIRAEEVQEDEDTKVDLPIDQVPADAVDEEAIDDQAVVNTNGHDEDVNVNVAASNADEHRESEPVIENNEVNENDEAGAEEEDYTAPVPAAAPPVTNTQPEEELVEEEVEEDQEDEVVQEPLPVVAPVPTELPTEEQNGVKVAEQHEDEILENEVLANNQEDDQVVGEDLVEVDAVVTTDGGDDQVSDEVEADLLTPLDDVEKNTEPQDEQVDSNDLVEAENLNQEELEEPKDHLENEVTEDQKVEEDKSAKIEDQPSEEVQNHEEAENDQDKPEDDQEVVIPNEIVAVPVVVSNDEDEAVVEVPSTPEVPAPVSETLPDTTTSEALPDVTTTSEAAQDLGEDPAVEDPTSAVAEEPEKHNEVTSDVNEENLANNEASISEDLAEDEHVEQEPVNAVEDLEKDDDQVLSEEIRPVTPSSPIPTTEEDALISFDDTPKETTEDLKEQPDIQRSSADGEAIIPTENSENVVTEDAVPLDNNGNVDESLKLVSPENTARFVNTRPASDALTVNDDPAVASSVEIKSSLPNGSAGVEVPP